jgi:hypothetical protein
MLTTGDDNRWRIVPTGRAARAIAVARGDLRRQQILNMRGAESS